jgi:hypothetical protein
VWLVAVVDSFIAPLRDCHGREDGREGHFKSNVVRVIIGKLVEVIGAGCGTDEKSGICVSWNVGHVCWCGVRYVVPSKKMEHLLQQRVHPMELRTLLGSSRKISGCSCCLCNWRDWKPAVLSRMNGWPLLYMGQVEI